MIDARYVRTTKVLEADLGDELVALDVEGGACFGFNPVATNVWRLLDSPKSFDELRATLLSQYEVSSEQCSEELNDLLGSLIDHGLIEKISS